MSWGISRERAWDRVHYSHDKNIIAYGEQPEAKVKKIVCPKEKLKREFDEKTAMFVDAMLASVRLNRS